MLTKSNTGRQGTDASINRFIKTCDIIEEIPERLALRAGALRALARQGSPIDAIVVALAEPGGAVLTSDLKDLRALANHTDGVHIYRA